MLIISPVIQVASATNNGQYLKFISTVSRGDHHKSLTAENKLLEKEEELFDVGQVVQKVLRKKKPLWSFADINP